MDIDFVDSDNGSRSGTVMEAKGRPLANAVLTTLVDSARVLVATTATDADGAYIFKNVIPGDYFVIESNPSDYPLDNQHHRIFVRR